jgi:hypothetical protein
MHDKATCRAGVLQLAGDCSPEPVGVRHGVVADEEGALHVHDDQGLRIGTHTHPAQGT